MVYIRFLVVSGGQRQHEREQQDQIIEEAERHQQLLHQEVGLRQRASPNKNDSYVINFSAELQA